MVESKVLRVGIIGQGRSGRDIHGRYLQQAGHLFSIVAVADPLPLRRERSKEEYGCQAYEDYREMLQKEELDLVVNASPSHLHLPISLECLAHGVHVLCEKPVARRVEEVEQLMDAAHQSGRLFAVFQQSRFSPAFLQIRKVIDSGKLGRIVQVSISYSGYARRWDWQTLQEYNGGSLLNTGPHPVDQALQFFATDMMPQVTCIMDRVTTFGDAEDYVKLLLHHPGFPTVDVEISSCNAYPAFTYSIQGSRGGLTGSLTHLEWKYFKAEEAPDQALIREPLESEDGSPAFCSESLPWQEEKWEFNGKDLFQIMSTSYYEMLYQSLTTGKPLQVTLEEVKQQIAVMEECHRQNPLPPLR